MNKHLVTYDLVGTDETSDDYARLIDAIKHYPWWGKIQMSAWIIRASDAAADVRTALARHIDADDRLFVARLSGETAWTRVICDETKLKNAIEAP